MNNRKDRQEYPKYLLRVFSERNRAEDFLANGKFDIQLIQTYRDIQDENRQDKDEGEGRLKIRGDIPVIKINRDGNILSVNRQPGCYEYSHSHLNPTYIFCMAGPQVDSSHLVKKYGQFLVRINNPRALIEDVEDFFSNRAWVELVECPYNKDEEVLMLPSVDARVLLSQSQKNEKDSPDKEWRLIVTMINLQDNENPYQVNLNKKLDYVEWIY
jgi:hypothetical protein